MIVYGSALKQSCARDDHPRPEEALRRLFSPLLADGEPVDAQFMDGSRRHVIGAAGLPFKAPVVAQLLKDPEVFRFLAWLWEGGASVLVRARGDGPPTADRRPRTGEARELGGTRGNSGGLGGTQDPGLSTQHAARSTQHAALVVDVYVSRGDPERVEGVPTDIATRMAELFEAVQGWAGTLDDQGRHVIDLKAPSPGPHFFTNLLIGNRIGHPRPLQTTPKGVVDHLGRGSFRSHADTQVLATRWDMRAEENGFPANRQFYLTENGRQIFYSANPADPNVESARTIHGTNITTIQYRTRCGLEITRRIFLLPQYEGLPLAAEVHTIEVANRSGRDRRLRLVSVGMFGPAQAAALREDVLYTNLTLEGRVLQERDGSVLAVSPHYHPFWAQEDLRFHSMVVHHGGHTHYPTEFCTSYNEFVGNGTLEQPEGLRLLSNRLARKGPGFFALATELELAAAEEARVDNFTGLVSAKVDPHFDGSSFESQVAALLERFGRPGKVDTALEANEAFLDGYTRHLQVESGDPLFDRYVNRNLPFQIFYQTFVSRSFDQTQKGHREVGAREIQDLFASMPLFIGSGQQQLVKDLLLEWASQVFEFGYANHNFYWTGKQPGEFSDDALWLVQAVGRYLRLSGDAAFLDEECEVAGASPSRRRTIYGTIQAILRYSGEISVGKHGIPLLDRADWNDTLQLDRDFLDGPRKEAAYRRQLAAGGKSGQPLESHYSESVMNGFLLKVAMDEACSMARLKQDATYLEGLKIASARLVDNLQRHAWKGDFFARVLFNKYPDGRFQYLGAGGDRLSADPSLDGTYFLNSFTWAILAGVATEEQVSTMLEVVKRVLWTPHGLKLCSPVDFSEIAGRGGSAEYFPGDRENGGVFKHADAMAAAAMFEAARNVSSTRLAEELADLAYGVLDVILPYRTMADPFVLCGNPRLCTQYNNSETGENVGPTLSGTATWLWLALNSALGLQITPEAIVADPILRRSQERLELRLRTGRADYLVAFWKPRGFHRSRDRRPAILLDGHAVDGPRAPHLADGLSHTLEVVFPAD